MLSLLAAAVVAVPGTALAVPPGNNSDVKIADAAVNGEVLDQDNNPKVCNFYLDFFSFDPAQEGDWHVEAWSGADQPKGTVVLSGHYVADPAGGYRSPASTASPNYYSLSNGQYKLFWDGRSAQNVKQKVFKVECAPESPAATYLTLVKNVVNTGGGTALASAWTLSATSEAKTISGPGGVARTEVPAGTYTLAEIGDMTNYDAGAWSCTDGTLAGKSLTLAAGDDATCSITNTFVPTEPAKTYLALTKLVVNTGGGQATASDWTLTAAAEGKTISGPGGVVRTEVPAGTYALSESVGVANYTQGEWSCTGGKLTGASLVLAAGDDVSCTITNTYHAPESPAATYLTLVKNVVNTGGGTALASAWTLSATSEAKTISGPGGVARTEVPAGTYTLAEIGDMTNYDAGAWSCTDGTLAGKSLTLAAGDDATCTITNTYGSEDVGGATGTPTPSESVEGATSQPKATPPATSTTGGSSSNENGLNVGLFLCLAVGILGAILVETQRRTVRRQPARRR